MDICFECWTTRRGERLEGGMGLGLGLGIGLDRWPLLGLKPELSVQNRGTEHSRSRIAERGGKKDEQRLSWRRSVSDD